MEKPRKAQFSFKKDGPMVEELYSVDNLTVSAIAKDLGRGYNTIKNYLEYRGLYTGPATGKKQQAQFTGTVPAQHKEGHKYFCATHNTVAIFRHYHNEACLVWLPDSNYLHYAYCKKSELTQSKGD